MDLESLFFWLELVGAFGSPAVIPHCDFLGLDLPRFADLFPMMSFLPDTKDSCWASAPLADQSMTAFLAERTACRLSHANRSEIDLDPLFAGYSCLSESQRIESAGC